MLLEPFLIDLRREVIFAAMIAVGLLFLTWLLSYCLKRMLLRLFPPKTFSAGIVSKRFEVKWKDKKAYTVYYMTFQPEHGGRAEYKTSSEDYALSATGDNGVLSLHMGKFKSFERS